MAEVKLEPRRRVCRERLGVHAGQPRSVQSPGHQGDCRSSPRSAWNRRSGGWRPIEEAPKDGRGYGPLGRLMAPGTGTTPQSGWANIFWEDDEGTFTPTSPTSCTSHP